MSASPLRGKAIFILLGPIVALAVYALLPEQYANEQGQSIVLTPGARAAGAVAAWMALWWMTEAIPVYVTALLPLAIFPLTGTAAIRATAASYGHEIIYLFLGGFILALALEKCGLHRRFAVRVLSVVGSRPGAIVAAFMSIAAFTSMWVTNTATTIMLLPVALSLSALLQDVEANGDRGAQTHFSLCLFLGIAYAASIGGVGTIIGTAPNLFVVSFVESQLGTTISFARWMSLGVPLVIAFVPLAWFVLCRCVYPLQRQPIAGADELLGRLAAELEPMSSAERRTLLVFAFTALAWVTRPLLNQVSLGGVMPLAGLTDTGIAIICALTLFVTPAGGAEQRFLMDWETAVRLPWGLLILFGGGLALAAALQATGFSGYLGSRTAVLAQLPLPLIVASIVTLMIFLTELTSNTATTATLVPIVFAVALGLGVEPLLLIMPAGIAASCAFMLPVATPPNAIVFGSGAITVAQMSRAGLWLNFAGILLITALTYALIVPLLGLQP